MISPVRTQGADTLVEISGGPLGGGLLGYLAL